MRARRTAAPRSSPSRSWPIPGSGSSAAVRSRRLRRTWLDTFDWRLFRAGLTLELSAGRGAAELVLTGRDGELVAVEPVTEPFRWPCLIDGAAGGPAREQLAPVVGVRALLPVARATSVVTQRRALNADEKTIAVVTIDQMTVTQPRRAATPPHGRRSARCAATRRRPASSPTCSRWRRASRRPSTPRSSRRCRRRAAGRATTPARSDVQLTGDMPAALAVATILTRLLDTMQANVPGTIRDIDTEFLHDLRIAVRRTRSVLKMAGSVLPAQHGRPGTGPSSSGSAT